MEGPHAPGHERDRGPDSAEDDPGHRAREGAKGPDGRDAATAVDEGVSLPPSPPRARQRAVVFDFDDTLVMYGRRRICVPRETWHVLMRLSDAGVRAYVVSYNSRAPFMAAHMGVLRYVAGIVTGRPPRDALVGELIRRYPDAGDFVYFDDRPDNIDEVRSRYPVCRYVHVTRTLRNGDVSPLLDDSFLFPSPDAGQRTGSDALP